jgi:glycerol-3-phosphate acyltransferase PlsY
MGFQLASALTLAFGYLLGSIPFGLLLTRVAGLGDVRNIGSGSIGATNVLRTGRRGLAAATLALDVLKGLAATLAAYYGAQIAGLAGNAADADMLAHIAGLGAFLGHIFPVWLGFKGGKGVATFIGILIGVSWPAAVLFCGIWLLVAFVTRYSSLSALIASPAVPVYYLVSGLAGIGFIAVMAVLIYVKHSANIGRLIRGQETKIGARSEVS